jgi:hypothetical protein
VLEVKDGTKETKILGKSQFEISIVFDNQSRQVPLPRTQPANVRDTMMMALLGKYSSASQAAKEQLKVDA